MRFVYILINTFSSLKGHFLVKVKVKGGVSCTREVVLPVVLILL